MQSKFALYAWPFLCIKIAWSLTLPICFEPNVGQVDRRFDFVQRLGPGYSLIARTELELSGVAIRFPGAQLGKRGVGAEPLGAHANFYRSSRSEEWKVQQPLFKRVNYSDLYPGVDVTYYDSQGSLEFDFVIHPGASQERIKLSFPSDISLTIEADGSLAIGTRLRLKALRAYQPDTQREISSRYRIEGQVVSFELGVYDLNKTLVIDPIAVFYLQPEIYRLKAMPDSAGNIVVAGTVSFEDPRVSGSTDLFVLKMAPDGSLLYVSYFRGRGGDTFDVAQVDSAGNCFVSGNSSPDFPSTASSGSFNGSVRSFVLKLSPAGVLLYSHTLPFMFPRSLFVDSSGKAYVAGSPYIENQSAMPVTATAIQPASRGGFNEGYVFALSSTGAELAYATYLGGHLNDYADHFLADKDGFLYISGLTCTPEILPVPAIRTGLPRDGNPCVNYIAKLPPAGNRIEWAVTLPPWSMHMMINSDAKVRFGMRLDATSVGAPRELLPYLGQYVFAGLSKDGTRFEFVTPVGGSYFSTSLGRHFITPFNRPPGTVGFPNIAVGTIGLDAVIAEYDDSGQFIQSTGSGALPNFNLQSIEASKEGVVYAAGIFARPYGWTWSLASSFETSLTGESPAVVRLEWPSSTPASLSKVRGDGQFALLGQPLPQPLEVEVRDTADRPVRNAPVMFQASLPGSRRSYAYSDDRGRALFAPTADDGPGLRLYTARLGSIPPVSFNVHVRVQPQVAQAAGRPQLGIPEYRVNTIAGTTDRSKERSVSAPLNSIEALATSSAGSIYLAESGIMQIRVARPDGTLAVMAGDGFSGDTGDGGPALRARFRSFASLAVDARGLLYVADTLSNKIRRIDPQTGSISTFANIAGPAGMCFAPSGDLFVSTPAIHRIYRIQPNGLSVVFAGNGIAGNGSNSDDLLSTALNTPHALACAPSGALYLAERVEPGRIRLISTNGSIETIAGSRPVFGADDEGKASLAWLNRPSALALDRNGDLIFADQTPTRWNQVSSTSRLRKLTRDGNYAFIAASSFFASISAAAPGADGHSIFADREAGTVFRWDGSTMRIVAGGDLPSGQRALETLLYSPSGVTADAQGNLYIADTASYRVRKVDSGGVVTTVAGDAKYQPNSSATRLRLGPVNAVHRDAAGNLLFSDKGIYRLEPGGALSSLGRTIAPIVGIAGDDRPFFSLAFGNSMIMRITRPNKWQHVAGASLSGYAGDGGPATYSTLAGATGLATDRQGNLYLADRLNSRIRKIDVNGIITTLAGNGTPGYSGDGGLAIAARLSTPSAVAVDKDGNLLIADTGNNRIRLVTTAGLIFTIAGNGTSSYSGDGVAALAASFRQPACVFADADGGIYICDTGNHLIRKLTRTTGPALPVNIPNAASYAAGAVVPDAFMTIFGQYLGRATDIAASLPLPASLGGLSIAIRDSAGFEGQAGILAATATQLSFLVPSGLVPGLGLLRIRTVEGANVEFPIIVASSTPGLFTANANGQGAPAATFDIARGDGSRSRQNAFRCGTTALSCVPEPVRVGGDEDFVALVLYGTGLRHANVSKTAVTIGGLDAEVLYVGPQGSDGLDQVNIRVPSALAGRGRVEVKITCEGRPANTVTIEIQ